MKELLEYLYKAEGHLVHRIKSESDITTPYGISRENHPDAAIFKFIDEVASEAGVKTPSNEWDENDLNNVNIFLAHHDDEVYKLVEEFYKIYLKNAHIELFPNECKIAMFSMFTNSPEGAWWSIQESILQISTSGTMLFSTPLSAADGGYGDKTKNAMDKILIEVQDSRFGGYYFETLMIFNMLRYYDMIIEDDEAKQKFNKGWNNRMKEFAGRK